MDILVRSGEFADDTIDTISSVVVVAYERERKSKIELLPWLMPCRWKQKKKYEEIMENKTRERAGEKLKRWEKQEKRKTNEIKKKIP